jgi:hypothetical protein
MISKNSASHCISFGRQSSGGAKWKGEKPVNGTNNTQGRDRKSIPPSALLIFSDGFNSLPIIVPNGGSEELDATIMCWLERKLVNRQGSKKVA